MLILIFAPDKQFTTSLQIFNIQIHSYPYQPMFFGKQLHPHVPQPLSLNPFPYPTLQITNAALSKTSQEAQLYIKINKQEILVCELSRKLGVLQSLLNVTVDLKDKPELVTKNGSVYLCGCYKEGNPSYLVAQNTKAVGQSATNKKTNSLQAKFQKAQTLPAQTLETSMSSDKKKQNNERESPKQPQQTFNPRQSSRLSSRRSTSTNIQPQKPSTTELTEPTLQRSSKRSQKQQKKSGQQKALLSNGRYNLKALLQNISDDDDDSDEESQVAFDDEDEEDDSDQDEDFDEDESEEEEEIKRPKKKVKQSSNLEGKDKKSNPSEQPKQVAPKQQSKKRAPIQVIQEQSSQKLQGNTQQFQQKWPQNAEEHQLAENTQVDQKIQELASKLKVPTIKPTI